MELKDRRKWEREFSRAYYENAEDFKERLRIIIRKNGGWTQGVDAIPWTVWEEYAGNLDELFDPLVYNVFLTSAQNLAKEAGVDFSWYMVNRRAAEYAKEYSYGLVRDITSTDRDLLADTVYKYYHQRMTLEEAVDLIEQSPAFGRARAELIAITEVTRTSVAGEYLQAEALRDQGWDLVPIWKTRYDEMVCPVCGPRNDIPRVDAWTPEGWTDPPPAHPRCRCWLNWVPRDQVPTPVPPTPPPIEKEPPKEKPKIPEEEKPWVGTPEGELPKPEYFAEMGIKKYVEQMLPDTKVMLNNIYFGNTDYEYSVAKQLHFIRTSGKFEKCLPDIFKMGYMDDFRYYQNCPAWASSATKTVSTNPNIGSWTEHIAQNIVNQGFWSHESTVAHEFGHIGHYRIMEINKFEVPNIKLPLSPIETKIAQNVSEYATADPYEFVAETFNGLTHGKVYNQAVLTLYKRYGGPEIAGVVEYTPEEFDGLRKMWPKRR